jgi:acyl-CoA:6-aminopenicillanic acid acyl transferase
MIVDLVHEIARKAENLADAIAIAKSRPASSSWGLAIGSARERAACVIELAGTNVEVVRPPAGAEHLICNNRYRSQPMQAGQLAGSAAWPIHSDRREQRLRQLFAAKERPLAPRDIARFLGDRRDPSAPERERRFGGILAQPTNVHCSVVKPSARRAWVGVDRAPVCEGTWADVAWTWDGPAGGWELGATTGSGFDAHVAADFVAAHDTATCSVHDALRALDRGDDAAARKHFDTAIAAAPGDPSLRLAAAWLALDAGADDRAAIHVHAGLATETEPYRRGQLLLWGARALDKRDPRQAAIWRTELGTLAGRGVDELQAAAARPRRRGRRIYPNINLVDAF